MDIEGHPERKALADSILRECKSSRPIASLETAISLLRQALAQQPPDHPMRGGFVRLLNQALLVRFHHFGWIQDIEEIISKEFAVVLSDAQDSENESASSSNDTQNGNLDESLDLISTAREMLDEFCRSDNAMTINTSIDIYHQIIVEPLAVDTNKLAVLDSLSEALLVRYHLQQQVEDLNEVIANSQQALAFLSTPDTRRSPHFLTVSSCLVARFFQIDEEEDFVSAFSNIRKLDDEDERAREACGDGAELVAEFQQAGDISKLHKGISLLNDSMDLRASPHPLRLTSLSNLANGLSIRFEQTGQQADLENSIRLHREALNLTPPSHPLRPNSLANLASALCTQIQNQNRPEILEEAILLQREALKLMPPHQRDRSALLNNLASSLLTQFERNGKLTDLDEAILFNREAIELIPAPDPLRCTSLPNLAGAIYMKFEHLGRIEDLEESILLLREALEMMPTTHPERSSLLYNLASTLSAQYEFQGRLADFEEPVLLLREVIQLRPASHPLHYASLNNLAQYLRTQFLRRGRVEDLDESISLLREAFELIPEAHPYRSVLCNNIANSLSTRFEQLGEPKDLDESIRFTREAVNLRPVPHPGRPDSLNNLGHELSVRFKHWGQREDLEESIFLLQESLRLLSPLHPHQSKTGYHLGESLVQLYLLTDEMQDLENAIDAFRIAASCDTASTVDQLDCAKIWARHANSQHHSSAAEAYRLAVGHFPRLASLDMNLTTRQDVLQRTNGLAGEACQFAISIGQLEEAVVFLSAGRAVFWSQALRLRTPLGALELVQPDLAGRLQQLAMELEHGSLRGWGQSVSDEPRIAIDKEKEAVKYRMLRDDWNLAVEQVRRLSGFENFLNPRPFEELQLAATNGPVILLNACQSGCDALIMKQSGVRHVPLPKVNLQRLEDLAFSIRNALHGDNIRLPDWFPKVQTMDARVDIDRKLVDHPNASRPPDAKFRLILKYLWNAIVFPILNESGMIKSHPTPASRMWWCPTGPFAHLPIHAAGIYEGENPQCLSDYAIPSYIATLETLLPKLDSTFTPEFKMLAVIQPTLPSRPELPALDHSIRELSLIENHVHERYVTKLGAKQLATAADVISYLPTSADVISHIPSSNFVHFSCHGIQDLINPLDSALLLTDGELKLSRIMETSTPHASLAFLSACETARGDEKLPDEAMHLSAAMLFAGFRGVVGTLWSIRDADGPRIADVFYGHLFRNGPDSRPDATEAALALHLAVKALRSSEGDVSFSRWVPFVHWGI